MSEFQIQDEAGRENSFLRLAFCGASGAGKTETMLRVAGGLQDAMLAMGKDLGPRRAKIGVLDTERRSASLYAGLARGNYPVVKPFATIWMEAPYSPARYLEAVKQFVIQGYPIVGVDQITHAWSGLGGLLEKKADLIKNEGYNSFDAFEIITPEQNRFIDALLSTNAHLIVTMRAKTAWVLETYTNKKGRESSRPKRVGMAPEQRAGTEYEFTSVINLDVDGNVGTVIKDRTGVFGPPGTIVGRMGEQHGLYLAQWLYEGREFTKPPVDATPAEKLAALEATAVSSMKLARTLPDLIAAFEGALTELRGIDIGGYGKKKTQDALIAAKDLRKAELAPAPSAGAGVGVGAMPLDHLEVTMLEDALKEHGIDGVEFLESFGIVRIAQLPPAKVDEARSWINANSKRAAA